VQALGGKTFDAKVTRTAWSLDPTNRSLRTEIDVINSEAILRPGMFATATILLDERHNVLALPATAIVRDGQDHFCWTVGGGKLERRKIEIGLRSGNDVEVSAGLALDQVVVSAPSGSLKPGQAVEVIATERK
jgi:RND family efflux transporter MFP subunit